MKINNLLRASLAMMAAGLFFISCKKENLNSQHSGNDPFSRKMGAVSLPVNAKTGPLGVCYVEVNNNNLLNVGSYTLKNGGQQLFDIAIIFAANINYDVAQQKAVLFFNDKVTAVLNGKTTYIKPLQDKGIKVLLSILGNHQGAGFCNFTSRASAKAFAEQLSAAVTTYNLDGIDFDDEYANYGANGTGQPNDSSFVMLLDELRKLMPDKIISFYDYGPASSRLSWNGQRAGDFVNYSWNAMYGTYSAPNVPPLGKSQLSPAAVWINNTSAATAKSLAQSTMTDGYGVFLSYDLPGTNVANYLSSYSTVLYGDSAKLSSPLQSWPPVTTPPAGGIVNGGTYEIKSGVNGTSNLDVQFSGTANGTKIQLYTDNSSNAQRWKLVDVGNGYYKIQSKLNAAKVMDVSGSSITNGAQIQLWDDNGTNAQKWKLVDLGSGNYKLQSALNASKVLDLNGGATADGTKIQLWSDNGGAAQKWKLELIP